MDDLALGIDLGTSNSVVAASRGGQAAVLGDAQGVRLQPSVVSWPLTGGTLVGRAALDRLAIDPAHTVRSSKRLMGRPIYSPEARRVQERAAWPLAEGPNRSCQFVLGERRAAPEDVAAEILRHLARVAEARLGHPCRRVVISVPATFREAQRSATLRAGELAGLEVIRLVNEPTAAALAYGFGRDAGEQTIAIYDLGGGTFDITILRQRGHVFEVRATAGDIFLGGDDVDDAIAARIAAAYTERTGVDPTPDRRIWQRLRLAAERVKCELSSAPWAATTLSEVMPGQALPSELAFELSRAQLDTIVEPLVQRTLVTCDEALRLAGLTSTDIDELVLVGGSTRLTLLREMVSGYFFREPRSDINPDEVVALGAAIYAGALSTPTWGDAVPREVVPERPTSARVRAARAAAEAALAARREGTTRSGLPAMVEDEDDSDTTTRVEHTSVGLPAFDRDEPDAVAPLEPPSSTTPGWRRGSAATAGAAPDARPSLPPLLVDVTSHALGIATLGGVFDAIIERNAKVPATRTREFTTTRDQQTTVRLRVLEGSGRRAEESDTLGELVLSHLRAAPRGEVRVVVSFSLDTNATLDVHARDAETGREAHATLRIAGLAQRAGDGGGGAAAGG